MSGATKPPNLTDRELFQKYNTHPLYTCRVITTDDLAHELVFTVPVTAPYHILRD